LRAAQYSDYGDPSVIEINEVKQPQAGEGQVLVEVHASSINPFDDKLRAGYMKDAIPLKFPFTPGGDVAGKVVEVGSEVTEFKPGDHVYGQATAVAGNSGAFAEFAVTKPGLLAIAPEVDEQMAGALPLVGLSALQAIYTELKLQKGEKLLIQGGAGSIGSLATQLAKHLGAHVAVTVSGGPDVDYAKEIGADVVIDYKTDRFEDHIKDYDAVFDATAGEVFNRSLDALKRGGRAVSMNATADQAKVKELGVTATTQKTKTSTAALDRLRELVNDGVLELRVDSVFPLAQTADAFRRQGSDARGKVVIKIK
jgi:2-desacetyl-2-hydroxyethyl bacteriochlorophyllide A dehydrogenase